MQRTLYDVLGVSNTASYIQIKQAFRTKAKKLHPDVNKTPGAQQQYLELQEAYTTLSHTYHRISYDSALQAQHTADNSIGHDMQNGDMYTTYHNQSSSNRHDFHSWQSWHMNAMSHHNNSTNNFDYVLHNNEHERNRQPAWHEWAKGDYDLPYDPLESNSSHQVDRSAHVHASKAYASTSEFWEWATRKGSRPTQDKEAASSNALGVTEPQNLDEAVSHLESLIYAGGVSFDDVEELLWMLHTAGCEQKVISRLNSIVTSHEDSISSTPSWMQEHKHTKQG